MDDAGAFAGHARTGRPVPLASSPPTWGVGAVLADLRQAVGHRPTHLPVTLRDIVAVLQGDAFQILTLILALVLVSPLSAIPGATTLCGLSIAAILVQQMLGRNRPWLPGFVLDRGQPAHRIAAALDRLVRPVAWVEGRLKHRLDWVLVTPVARVPLLLVFLAAICTPMMELIPGTGTVLGTGIALFSAGRLARDGVLVLLGACLAVILPATIWLILL